MAYERGGNFLEDARKKLNREAIRPRCCRFSIGSAPLTSITKSDAQISGGETRQDYKDTRRFPLMAPSCALLFLPFGLPVSLGVEGQPDENVREVHFLSGQTSKENEDFVYSFR